MCEAVFEFHYASFISASDEIDLLFFFFQIQYAHRKCVQHWCNEKGDITCEICHQVCLLLSKLLWAIIVIEWIVTFLDSSFLKFFKFFTFSRFLDFLSGAQPYQPGYTAPPPRPEETAIDIG